MKILSVDTCFGACSTAILDGSSVRAHRFEVMERGHAEALAPMVEDAMRESTLAFGEIERLAVTVGPGTFTGQRVGLAFMRGLRLALKKPLVGVTSLETMAAEAANETSLRCTAALHDARRDEVYLEIIDCGTTLVAPVVVKFADAIAQLESLPGPVALSGTAAPRARDAIAPDNPARLSRVRHPDALWAARLARTRTPGDAPPQPLYLRPPDARLPVAT